MDSRRLFKVMFIALCVLLSHIAYITASLFNLQVTKMKRKRAFSNGKQQSREPIQHTHKYVQHIRNGMAQAKLGKKATINILGVLCVMNMIPLDTIFQSQN